MPLMYAEIDRLIIREGASITIPEYVQPVSGIGSNTIPIQFPPRITNDTKSRQWKEAHNAASWEEIVTFSTATAREIGIQLTYVVTGGEWSARKIASTVRDLRSYFYATVNSGDIVPVYIIQMYDMVPPSPRTGGIRQTFRGKSISVKPSDTLIRDTSEGEPVIYPLKVEVNLSLALITQINDEKFQKSQYAFTNLEPKPPQEWY
jgi:hypothetical protein